MVLLFCRARLKASARQGKLAPDDSLRSLSSLTGTKKRRSERKGRRRRDTPSAHSAGTPFLRARFERYLTQKPNAVEHAQLRMAVIDELIDPTAEFQMAKVKWQMANVRKP